MTLHTKILNEFLNSNIKIISLDRLNEYISYCLEHNQNERVRLNNINISEYHHILPKSESCFPQYTNLKDNPWNGTHLLYSYHYYAHWLLARSIDDYGQLLAVYLMNKNNIDISQYNKIKLTYLTKTLEIKNGTSIAKKRAKKAANTMSKIQENGKTIYELSAEKHSKTVNNVQWKESIGIIQTKKRLDALSKIQENGKTVAENGINLRKKTMSMVQDSGMTKYQERGVKCSITKKSKEWKETIGKKSTEKHKNTLSKIQENGLTIAQNRGKVTAITLAVKSINKFGLFNIYKNDILLFSGILRKGIMKISSTLINTTQEKPMGSTKGSLVRLCNFNKEYLIGCYVLNIKKINSQNTPNITNNLNIENTENISTVDLIKKLKESK